MKREAALLFLEHLGLVTMSTFCILYEAVYHQLTAYGLENI
jgi:hypothetical protein